VIDDNLADLDDVKLFDVNSLRTVFHEPVNRSIYAPGIGVLQHVYGYSSGFLTELSLRRTIGLPRLGSVFELIWVKGADAQGAAIYVGVESEYVYERTRMLVTPSIAGEANQYTIPVYAVMEAVLFELEPILGFEVQQLLSRDALPELLVSKPLSDYLALDHKNRCKLIIVSSRDCLDQMEIEASNYCYELIERKREFSQRIRTPITLGLHPVKRHWGEYDLSALDCGDLLALKGARIDASNYLLRGFLQLRRAGRLGYKYEVQYNMSDDDISLEFSGESIDDYQQSTLEMDVAPHEQIELDILIGHTNIPLGELCAVQSGTLIELGQHNLPLVTLCVNGEPILEGELVHFKDQLMVQVTKRLA